MNLPSLTAFTVPILALALSSCVEYPTSYGAYSSPYYNPNRYANWDDGYGMKSDSDEDVSSEEPIGAEVESATDVEPSLTSDDIAQKQKALGDSIKRHQRAIEVNIIKRTDVNSNDYQINRASEELDRSEQDLKAKQRTESELKSEDREYMRKQLRP